MNTNHNQLALSSLLIDLLMLNGSTLILAKIYPDISSYNLKQLFSFIIILNVAFVFTSIPLAKKWFYLQADFLCRLSLKFLNYFLISCISVSILFPDYHQHFFFKNSSLFFSGILCIYYLINKYFYYKQNIEFNIQRVAIISKCRTSLMIERIIKNNPSLGYQFIGFITKDKSEPEHDILGSLLDLDEIIDRYRIQFIIAVQNFDKSLVSTCDKHGVRLGVVPKDEKYNLNNSNCVKRIEIIKIHENPLDNKILRMAKRSFDIIFSLSIVVFVLSWLLPVMAFIIKATSRGPVFFTQKRTGIHNSTFSCYKLRSMVVNTLSDVKQATTNDSRITFIGKYLRKTNIDELPQFFNVLIGQMSVIGPRPHMLKHTQYYSRMIKNYLMRHYIKPGITGWAQVNGFHGETDELWKMEKRVEHDLWYIENWSILLDLKIIFLTLFPHKIYHKSAIKVPSHISSDIIISDNRVQEQTLKARKKVVEQQEPAF